MSDVEGTDIIGALMLADTALVALVAPENMKAGRLPDGITLPALLAQTVSVIDRQPLVRTGLVRRVDRVSVTVRAASHRDRKKIIAAVRTCCMGSTGNIGGAVNVSIQPAGMGPDVNGPGNSFERTQDFRVSFDA